MKGLCKHGPVNARYVFETGSHRAGPQKHLGLHVLGNGLMNLGVDSFTFSISVPATLQHNPGYRREPLSACNLGSEVSFSLS